MSGDGLALVIAAAAAGLLMAVQGTWNSALAKAAGLWEATFIVHLIGMVATAILLFAFKLGSADYNRLAQAPWYGWLGGILGVLIVYGVVRSIPKVGVAAATTAIILGQVSTAALVDHLGLFGMERIPFGWLNILGIVLMAAGGWLLLHK